MVNGVPQLGPPKSVRSRRTIPIPEQFCPYVRYLREHSGTPYVWTCSGGNPLYGVGSFRRRFYTALKNVGQVRKLSPHCCRHTYVTMLQANGVPMETIAALTGHSDIKPRAICTSLRIRSQKRSKCSTARRPPEPPERRLYG